MTRQEKEQQKDEKPREGGLQVIFQTQTTLKHQGRSVKTGEMQTRTSWGEGRRQMNGETEPCIDGSGCCPQIWKDKIKWLMVQSGGFLNSSCMRTRVK